LLVHAAMMSRPIGLSNAGHRGRPLFQTKNLPTDQNRPTKKVCNICSGTEPKRVG
jgi:hypothetical protein